MTDVPNEVPHQSELTATRLRKPYQPPTLTLFGHVAALTQGDSCSAASDGSNTCPAAAAGNMGML